MAAILHEPKPLAVNPLKVSQPVGASLALLGMARAMPLEHGARGCTSFNKLFFMRHFREPIALQTTAMEQMVTILGADDNVVEALHTIATRHAPELVGLITTGLVETQGADIARTVRAFRQRHPENAGMAIATVNATDALGCLETGFALAVEALVDQFVPERPADGPLGGRVNVLVSSALGPGDLEGLRNWIEAFDLQPVFVPDIGDSLDGHLIDEGYSPLTYGGTPVAALRDLGRAMATLVIGPSMIGAAQRLRQRTGVPDHHFDRLVGLPASDAFTRTLSEISGRPVPARLRRQREQLLDAMVDCQFQVGGARVALGAEADLMLALGSTLQELGAELVSTVTPARVPALAHLPWAQVRVGDLEDLENEARAAEADLIVTNSHGSDIATRLGVPLLHAGYPQYDLYGAQARCWIGYRGTRQLVFDLANLLQRHHQEIRPYRSRYWAGTPREHEAALPALDTRSTP